ncbi:hypothetical protein ACHAXT_010408 [Thalassiosira profunda]
MEPSHLMQHRPLHQPAHGQLPGGGGGSRSSSRASSRCRDGSEMAEDDAQHSGHIIQSRSALASHSLSKRARSRSKGRRRRQAAQDAQQEVHNVGQEIQQAQSLMRARQLSSDKLDAFDDFISGEVETSAIRREDMAAIASAVHTLPSGKINYMHEGAGSSQPSTMTHQTVTTAEDSSSVKSWTVSEASGSDNEGGSNQSKASKESAETMFRPPPPPRPRPGTNQRQPPTLPKRQQLQQTQPHSSAPAKFDPIQSLKELGRKLVQESEAENSLAIFDDGSTVASAALQSRYPPPPPKRDIRTSSGRQIRPPPRGSPMVDSSEKILGEASDILARMESLTSEGGEPSAAHRAKARQRLAQQYQEERLKISGTEESLTQACDVVNMMENMDFQEQQRTDDEKAARAQRRREKAERKAARHRERELRKQQLQHQLTNDGTFTMPMNDEPVRRGRGREMAPGGGTDDILQAAAAIRARARRSASRSRERVKEASLFIGETPADTAYDSEGDHISLSSEKRRSILNPHGLENQPAPTRIERRSQSRERRRSSSGGRNADQSDSRSIGDRSSRRYTPPNQPRTAEELLSRRREMRQRIAKRQTHAESKRDHRRAGSGGREEMSIGNEWQDGRSQSIESAAMRRRSRSRGRTDDRSEGRRGRSRSVVRDGISKIRSASLKPFKSKKGDSIGKSWDNEGESVGSGGTGRRSFKRMLSKSKPRSLSRGRSVGGRSVGGEWAIKSDPFVVNDDDNKSGGARSMSASSALDLAKGVFKKVKSKPKNKGGGGGLGMVRSLSRGSFRHQTHDLSDTRSEAFPTRNENEWEMRSLGRPNPFRSSGSYGGDSYGY